MKNKYLITLEDLLKMYPQKNNNYLSSPIYVTFSESKMQEYLIEKGLFITEVYKYDDDISTPFVLHISSSLMKYILEYDAYYIFQIIVKASWCEGPRLLKDNWEIWNNIEIKYSQNLDLMIDIKDDQRNQIFFELFTMVVDGRGGRYDPYIYLQDIKSSKFADIDFLFKSDNIDYFSNEKYHLWFGLSEEKQLLDDIILAYKNEKKEEEKKQELLQIEREKEHEEYCNMMYKNLIGDISDEEFNEWVEKNNEEILKRYDTDQSDELPF